jgi:MFS superfamily sulfate permease-like transporter
VIGGAAAVVAVVLVILFLVGVAVGIVMVVAVSVRRAGKAVRPERKPVELRRTWPYLDEADLDDNEPGEPPQ